MPARRRSILLPQLRNAAPRAVLEELRRAILEGAVPPGTPIPLGEVADHFQVSHIPVREALKTLVAEGLVDHQPHGGYSVAQLTAAELREIYIVRETLESASLAAAVANATDADRATVVAINEQLEQAIQRDDPVAYNRLSREFHHALTAPSRMHRLLRMLESAWNITEPVQPMVHVAPAERAALHADHQELVAAFLDSDVPRLLELSERHHGRLNDAIATLPTDTGLLADE